MLAFKVALKNLIGAGLRTWLNVAVLSFAFVIIILYNGMMDGWNQQARTDTIKWEVGNGQIWQEDYDPYDPFTIQDAHAVIPKTLEQDIEKETIIPQLFIQGTIYPNGRMQSVLLKGITPEQKLLELPTSKLLANKEGEIPTIIGKRMAKSANLAVGDRVLLRWRDKNGTFDAREILIQDIFDSNVPTVDLGQIWLDLKLLQDMTGMSNEATLFVVNDEYKHQEIPSWKHQELSVLMADLDAIIASKKGSGIVLYGLLLIIALLAIFDTQVLSIFKRQKEIGTYIALGMTRWQVTGLFTIEGAAHSILAVLVAFIWGGPFLYYISSIGIPVNSTQADEIGLAMSESIIPVYGIGLIVSTILLVVISSTIVSFLPARKIARMKPTEALKGKLQ